MVLVPANQPLPNYAGPGFGFPVRFRVEAGGEDGAPRPVADHTREDFPNPGVLPVWLNAPGVRVTITEPWTRPRARDAALAEIMVLRGARNLATGRLGVRVAASHSNEASFQWARENLIDGLSPLGASLRGAMPAGRRAGQGTESLRHCASQLRGEAQWTSAPGRGTTLVFRGRVPS